MPNPTDPRAVADDPSGIVQQMPEVRLRADGRCSTDSTMRHFAYAVMVPDPAGDYVEYEKARATEADLRAEVERLRAQAKGMTALLRAGCDLLSLESEALRKSVNIIGEPDRLSDDPEDAPTIAAITEIEDWIASVKATLFPPALSPETDGGQDD